ncbi:MAG TPA: peptidoglycan-binding protein [Myxococcales bacterium]|nr:peptidoglycan-binding protein [Myxococcales bacterium]
MSDYLDLKPGPFQQSTIAGGLPKLVRIWEYLRDLNEGGYGSGRLVKMKNGPDKTLNKKTDCSPFTATAIYMALDPREVDVKKPYDLKEPYDPRFNGGEELTKYFYWMHNSFKTPEYKNAKTGAWWPDFKKNYLDRAPGLSADWGLFNDSAGSVVFHNLGVPVDDRKMRRGDLVGINWMSGGGHAVFCWNVHLNAKGEVDCFQYVSANGAAGVGGPGVTVIQYPVDSNYLKVNGGKYSKQKDMFVGIIDDPKAYPEYSKAPYQWYALRHIETKDIDKSSFGVPANQVTIVDWKFTWKGMKLGVNTVMVARLNGVTPPEPWLKAGEKTIPDPEPAKPKPAPVTAKSKPVETPKAAPQPEKKPAEKKAEEKKPVQAPVQDHQEDVEMHLQILWGARWIGADPGESKNVNDAQSQAAIKDFQARYMKDQKVPQPGHADPATRQRLARYAGWALGTPLVNLALHTLHEHGELTLAPGDNPAQLDEKSVAAVKEFQEKKKLQKDGIPGSVTQAALAAAMKAIGGSSGTPAPAPAPAQPAKDAKPAPAPAPPKKQADVKKNPPAIWDVYFTRNFGKAGDKVTVVVVAFNSEKQSFDVGLYQDDKALVEKAGQVTIARGKGKLEVQVPSSLGPGAMMEARVSGQGLSGKTAVLFEVATADADKESADWRPYIGKPELPAGVLEAVRRNRAKYPVKELTPVASTADKYRGANHYNYDPPADHASWAKDYFKKKMDGATLERKHQLQAYLEMLDHEGRPASMQTYDSQVVTWGVGTGAMGNGKDVFLNLNKDAKPVKQLLDEVGLAYDGDYHVVDLAQKKVVSSVEGKKTKADPSGKGDDSRHRIPLDSWRHQPDLLSAVIAISEDKANRESIAEAQFAVYLKGAANWKGQDKVFTRALYFMIVHLGAWYPALAKFDVAGEFAKGGGGTPSVETDKKLAPRIANAFVKNGKAYFGAGATYDDIRTRTKTKVWAALRDDGKAEGFDPGELTYDFE